MHPLPAPTAVIADDERLMREQIIDRLKEAWPELSIVGEATNGREAVALARSLEPDIVFLDINMPEMDGIKAAKAIAVNDWAKRRAISTDQLPVMKPTVLEWKSVTPNLEASFLFQHLLQ